VIIQTDLNDLCQAASIAGFDVEASALSVEAWEAGDRHSPTELPDGKAAVYVFVANGECLKVGKVNSKSRSRFRYQHYSAESSRSNLARSLMGDEVFQSMIGNSDCGEWIRKNTTRYNILIPVELGEAFVHFAEAFMILKLNPRFEAG
jgi:hypothetical protein